MKLARTIEHSQQAQCDILGFCRRSCVAHTVCPVFDNAVVGQDGDIELCRELVAGFSPCEWEEVMLSSPLFLFLRLCLNKKRALNLTSRKCVCA